MSLQATDIAFGYPGAAKLYEGFSLTVEAGERVALCGRSGVGKTTLCRLLAGYLRPQNGEIWVDGAPLAARGQRSVQLIGQHPEQALDPRMRLGRSLAEGVCGLRYDQAIERARTLGLLDAFGIRDEWLTRFPHELSGGELMRFCIARALLAEPAYLICDEMTAMLDAVTQAEVWRAMLAIARERNMGLVIVSHSPALLDRIGVRRVDVR
ncbi:ABC transporter ATP-binding protein [Collinsella tanakaei]|uniref:ABC transporter ATP-binding protein n=1 Tax=Collinsella tanakaei TaxID=626935 RepID=UPI0025A40197|nr:ATP-binding cassette domain-containing protein [Collinsella tanakaei]MDM8301070.1 ATP-binding cassette domain-containing protein [Collinsella tanakaei]